MNDVMMQETLYRECPVGIEYEHLEIREFGGRHEDGGKFKVVLL